MPVSDYEIFESGMIPHRYANDPQFCGVLSGGTAKVHKNALRSFWKKDFKHTEKLVALFDFLDVENRGFTYALPLKNSAKSW